MASDRKSPRATVSVTVRWWVGPYLQALVFFAWVMGTEPDYQRLAELLKRRGVKVTVRLD